MARRPPKRIAEIGTPRGSSHSGAMAGHCAAGAVNRALGWAAAVPDAGVQSLPFQSMRCAGGSDVMSSHHTSPSSVLATLVKMVLASMERIAFAFVASFVPGATPKNPASGLIAYSRPSSPNFIQQMSSPMVSAFQPGDCRLQHRQIGLTARRRKRGGDVLRFAGRAGELEDQHVLGQPSVVAGHHGRDTQREALLAQKSVASVPGSERPDVARLREVDDVLVVGVAGPWSVGVARSQRCPYGVHAWHPLVVAEHVEGSLAHAGHDPHADSDVRTVGQLHADVGDGRSERTHAERHDVHRAALHRTGVQTEHLGTHHRRGAPVVGRPCTSLISRTDEGPVFDASDVGGIAVRPVTVGALCLVELSERAGVHQLLTQSVVLVSRAVAPVHIVRLQHGDPLVHPSLQAFVGRRSTHRVSTPSDTSRRCAGSLR